MQSFDPFVTVGEVFTSEEVIAIRSIIEDGEKVSAKVGSTKENTAEVKEIRSSRIKWIDVFDKEHEWIFQRLVMTINTVNPLYFGLDLTGLENLQLTEYDENYDGHYSMHIDSSWKKAVSNHRKLSIVVQLSDPDTYEGGDLVLYPDSLKTPYTAPKALGEVVLFRSNIIHEAKPVTKGKRYSLVAWVLGPLPK